MSNTTEVNLENFNCASGRTDHTHLCEYPIALSCSHFICKSCILPNLDYKKIECSICKQLNNRDLNESPKSSEFSTLLEKHFNELFNALYKDFVDKLELSKNVIRDYEEMIETKAKFVKEEIDIRIESLKNELDNMKDALYTELDSVKEHWKNFNSQEIKLKDIEQSVTQLQTNTSKSQKQSQESLYECQKNLNKIKDFIFKYFYDSPVIEFDASPLTIERQYIGNIRYSFGDEYDHNEIMSRAVINQISKTKVDGLISSMCILPDGKLLLSDVNYGQFYLFDKQFKLIKKISEIDGHVYRANSLAINKKNEIYFSDFDNHLIVKIDSKFQKLAIFDGNEGKGDENLSNPYGICYSGGFLYVCNFGNSRIMKLSDELYYQDSWPLDYVPWDIKIIKQVACIREFYGNDSERRSIRFHDTKTFTELRNYEGHSGVIGASSLYFYEFSFVSGKLYFYNNKGEFKNSIQTTFRENISSDGTINMSCSNLLICNKSPYIYKI